MCSSTKIKYSAFVSLLASLLFFFMEVNQSLPDLLHQIRHNFTQALPLDVFNFRINPYMDILFFYFSIVLLLLTLILFFFPAKVSSFCQQLKSLIIDFVQSILHLPLFYLRLLLFLLIISLLLRVFLMINMPVFVDEAWTYLVFSGKGVLTSMSYYPAPNNHILHSLLTSFSVRLPIDILWALRLPNLWINLLLILVFYVVFNKIFNRQTAWASTLVFAFSFPVLYYGYIARGYSLYLLAFALLFYVAMQLLRDSSAFSGKYKVLWLIAGLIGFYSLPAFLYPYFSVSVFLLVFLFVTQKRIVIKDFILVNVRLILLVILLYLPVLWVSGMHAFSDNPYMQRMSRISVWYNLDENLENVSRFFFNMPVFAFVFLFLSGLILLRKKLLSPEILFSIFLIVFPPVLMLMHGTSPGARLWIYELVPVLFIFSCLYESLRPKDDKIFRFYMLLPFLLAFIELLSFSFSINSYESDSFLAQKIDLYLQKKQADNLIAGKDTYLGASVYFDFLAREEQMKFRENQPLTQEIIDNFDYFLMRYPLDETFQKQQHLQLKIFKYADAVQYLYYKKH